MNRYVILLALCLCARGYVSAGYDPFVDGAKADVRIKVVDDLGEPVRDAMVSAVFLTDVQKVDVTKGATDSKGCFSAARTCIGQMRLWIRKDGYYDTKTVPTEFRTNTGAEATKTHRWSEQTVELPVVLKKQRNPVKLIHKGGTYSDIKYPILAEVKGFDLERFDWCPPYGKGRYADIQISTEYWRDEKDWLKVYDKTVVSMTNTLDGAYFADIDAFSSMRYPYAANTNAVFQREFIFEYDRRTGNVTKNITMPKGKCLVFRTRTKLDEKGCLKEANYGIITESFDPFADLDLEVFFNPTPNDTNLEAVRTTKK